MNEIMAIPLDQLELIRKTIGSGLSDNELALFLHTAKSRGLDPLQRQIHPLKLGGRLTCYTGIDGLRLIAARTGHYRPDDEPPRYQVEDGRIISCTVKVWVQDNAGAWFPVAASAFMEEYFQDRNPIWKKMPRVMLAKVAESIALRKAFPGELSGLYGDAELPGAEEPRPVESKPVPVPAPALPAPEEKPDVETPVYMYHKEVIGNYVKRQGWDQPMLVAKLGAYQAGCAAVEQLTPEVAEKLAKKILKTVYKPSVKAEV